jgi:glycosyltransferase involved in cell wall biosynthesis
MDVAPRPRFLYAGQLVPRKGVDYLLSAWSILQKVTRTHGSLLIVGEGSQQPELQRQVRTLLLKEVYFPGKVEHAALGSWYRSCDVFVFPTLEDTWGNVVPEAMAFGKPTLCSQYACAAELVSHGENGFIFDPKNPQELAGLMLKFVNSPQLMAKFGRKSKEIMRSHTMNTAVRAIADVINPLLEDAKDDYRRR